MPSPGSGPTTELFAGGEFTQAGDFFSAFLDAWSCVGSAAGTPLCYGDGSGTSCPCGNPGATGHGCENSATTGGARLAGSGVASLASDSVVLTASGERPTAFSLFLQGKVEVSSPLLYGDGLRCIGGALKRLYSRNASGGVAAAPVGAELPVSQRSHAVGDSILAGETRTYQVAYRDPNPTFCPSPTGGTFNVSQALRILWAP
jgi:hypothetical protein